MAYFFFIDESGQDHINSPYEVLAGVVVRDKDIGRLTQEAHDLEMRHFGRRYSAGKNELKGTHLLKRKVFQHRDLNVAILPHQICELAKSALDFGSSAGVRELKSLALAKLNYVTDLLTLCHKLNCKVFASITTIDAPKTATDGLRKDYAYLFERFYYFLEDLHMHEQGVVIFDELEKSQSHILIGQMFKYFRETSTGRQRASLIVPEPFFVHSELTTGVQLADIVAYTISWTWRTNYFNKPRRDELLGFMSQISGLRYYTTRSRPGQPKLNVGSFAYISDLRTNLERLSERALDEAGE